MATRSQRRIPRSLVNLVLGERVVPELLQDEASPQGLSAALLALLRDSAARKRQIERFRDFHILLRQNNAEKAADAVLEVMDGKRDGKRS